jgi:hypothetical protein
MMKHYAVWGLKKQPQTLDVLAIVDGNVGFAALLTFIIFFNNKKLLSL